MNTLQTESRKHRGFTITVTWFYDEDYGLPWEEDDGHGPVSEWTRRDKYPGERVLCEDRGSRRYYDFAEAVKIAKRDGWDAPPYKTGTKGERASRAAEADFKLLQDFCNDRWHWAGYTVSIDGKDWEDSLWGIDSTSIPDYTETAFADAIRWLDRELLNAESAACADIVTV